MKPYKLRHIPSGLFYQPHKHRGSNVSERGKIYQTSTHGLSSAIRYRDKFGESHNRFMIQVQEDSRVHKLLKDIIAFEECSWSYKQVRALTKLEDWEIVEI